jgi:2-keto-4-pentenoate hydratase
VKSTHLPELIVPNAAQLIWTNFCDSTQINALPESCRPRTRAEGYAVQAEVARLSGQACVGWKIAATSLAGQKHINVDGPLAGRLLADRVFTASTEAANSIDLRSNLLRVVEAEFTFRMARALPRRDTLVAAYSVDEVMSAVASLHLAIEIPDCRLRDYVDVGTPSLIADLACASWWIVGDAVAVDWRSIDLAAHKVTAHKNGAVAAEGMGSNVLGDPRVALTWLANELCTYGSGLAAGDYVTTGTCVVPVPCAPGDAFAMDFGVLGTISCAFP